MKHFRACLLAMAIVLGSGGTPVLADCGFCAREVTLSETLAQCYLERFAGELDQVRAEGIEVHLVELGACLGGRGGSPMPEPTVQRDSHVDIEVDESFLIPVAAMECLADALQQADFKSAAAISIEVRSEC